MATVRRFSLSRRPYKAQTKFRCYNGRYVYTFDSRGTYGRFDRSIQGFEEIWFEIVTSQMPIFQGKEFQIQEDKVCYTPLKDKCDAIRNLESPKTLRQTRAFCGVVNFLLSFLPNLRRLLIRYMTYKRKRKSLNGLKKLRDHLLTLKSY